MAFEKLTELGEAPAYLRELVEKLMHIPVKYGVDQADADTLDRIAKGLEQVMKSPEADKPWWFVAYGWRNSGHPRWEATEKVTQMHPVELLIHLRENHGDRCSYRIDFAVEITVDQAAGWEGLVG